jgi:hypothetical protein
VLTAEQVAWRRLARQRERSRRYYLRNKLRIRDRYVALERPRFSCPCTVGKQILLLGYKQHLHSTRHERWMAENLVQVPDVERIDYMAAMCRSLTRSPQPQ